MTISNRTPDDNHALSIYTDQSTQDYYRNLYNLPDDPIADNVYSEAEYGNYNHLFNRVTPPTAKL